MSTNGDNWTEDDIRRMLANPFYCIATDGQSPMISEDEWIKAGSKLIKEIGAEQYLGLLIDNIKATLGPQ